jgi:Transposase DDE domain
MIPYRRHTKKEPRFRPKHPSRLRAGIEQFIGRFKRFKRHAMRCEKTNQNDATFVALACIFNPVKSIHKGQGVAFFPPRRRRSPTPSRIRKLWPPNGRRIPLGDPKDRGGLSVSLDAL